MTIEELRKWVKQNESICMRVTTTTHRKYVGDVSVHHSKANVFVFEGVTIRATVLRAIARTQPLDGQVYGTHCGIRVVHQTGFYMFHDMADIEELSKWETE